MTVDEMVGQELHLRMWKRGISQSRMADRLGISQATVSKKLRGLVPWSLNELYEASAALGCDPTELLPQVDSNHQPFVLRVA